MKSALLLIFGILFNAFLLAQPSQPGAEATALGGTYVTQHTVFSTRHNVAGIAFEEKNAVAFGLRNNYLASNLNDFYLLSAFNLGAGKLGVDFLNYGFEAYQQNEIGLSYALKLNSHWSFGSRLRYAHCAIPQESLNRYLLSADVGLLRKSNNWRYGATVQNIIQSKWQGRNVEAEPVVFRVGAGYYFSKEATVSAEFYKASNAAADFRFGVNYKIVEQLDIRFGFGTLQPNVSFGFGIFCKGFSNQCCRSMAPTIGLEPRNRFCVCMVKFYFLPASLLPN